MMIMSNFAYDTPVLNGKVDVCARITARLNLLLGSDGFDAAEDHAIIGMRYCHESRMVRVVVYRCCEQGFPAKVESMVCVDSGRELC